MCFILFDVIDTVSILYIISYILRRYSFSPIAEDKLLKPYSFLVRSKNFIFLV